MRLIRARTIAQTNSRMYCVKRHRRIMKQRCFFRKEILISHARRVGIVFIKFPNAHADFQESFKSRLCVHRNPLRTISKIEIEADNWVKINPIIPKYTPLRDLKETIPLAPIIKIGDYDHPSLVSLVTAGNVGSRDISLMSVREGEDRNKTNMFQQDRRKNVIPEIADSDENKGSLMPEQQTLPYPKQQRR